MSRVSESVTDLQRQVALSRCTSAHQVSSIHEVVVAVVVTLLSLLLNAEGSNILNTLSKMGGDGAGA